MKIILTNFRHHKHLELEFDDKGFFLISGKSGVGKTTLLNAIYHGFYGKCRKPYTHGTNTCIVEITYRDLYIKRSNRPNRLIVNYCGEEYEDDSAQNVIEKYLFMNHTEFLVSSYIVQRIDNSVISMTPSDQLKFVEKIAFADKTHQEIREKCKEHLKDLKQQLIYMEGQKAVLDSQLEQLDDIESPQKPTTSLEDLKKQKHELHNEAQHQ